MEQVVCLIRQGFNFLWQGLLFDAEYNLDTMPLLGEHRAFGTVVVSEMTHLARVLMAAEDLNPQGYWEIQDERFTTNPFVLPQKETRKTQLLIDEPSNNENGGLKFRTVSLPADGGEWMTHASGCLVPQSGPRFQHRSRGRP